MIEVNSEGLFVTAEGGDGSGKATQIRELATWAEEEDLRPLQFSFPRYGKPVAKPIEQFLNGDFGNPHPVLAGIPYSVDRATAADEIRAHLATGGMVISDRFTNSNSGHNGSKFDTEAERLAYFEWLREYEYDLLKIPKPDHNFILLTPPDIAQLNVDKKAKRSYTDKKRDIHEADSDHLRRTYETYQLLAATYPDEFMLIDTMETSKRQMRSIEDIQEQIRDSVRTLLKAHKIAQVTRED